jgi:hypothetical protein
MARNIKVLLQEQDDLNELYSQVQKATTEFALRNSLSRVTGSLELTLEKIRDRNKELSDLIESEGQSLELNLCPRCHTKSGLRVHQFGHFFVKCHQCESNGASTCGFTATTEIKAIRKWNNGEIEKN